MSKKFVLIIADTNDADYITSKNSITDEEIEFMKPIIAALNVRRDKANEAPKEQLDKWIENHNKYSHNWETSDYGPWQGTPKQMYIDTGILTQEQVDFFNELVPYGEDGIHTVKSIEIVYEGEKLF